jgi:SAM-dependent methyltransferase
LEKGEIKVLPGRQNDANRVKWLEKTLAKIPAGSRILDAGAGELRFKKFCSHLKYVAQDFAQYDGKGDSVGLQMGAWDQNRLDIICDICNIPEPDKSFDVILCVEVFEHLPNPVAAIKEFGRLLRAGGNLILTAPFCSLTHQSPFHFSTGFNRYFYEKHLPEHGLKIIEMEKNGNFFEYLAQEIWRIPSMAKRYAAKHPGPLEMFAMMIMLKMLGRFSRVDTGSSEILCYGYHVLARKER